MDNYQIKEHARISLKGNWGLAILPNFLVFLILGGLTTGVEIAMSGGFTIWLNQDETPASADLINMIISFALMPLSVSVYWFFLSLIRFEGPKISDIFAIFKAGKTYFKLILNTILTGIFVLLWTLLLIIPGIIKSISYSQSYYLLKDHPEYSALEAITESKKRMNGYKGKYFLLNLSFIGWGLLCILTLGIGFLWLAPYMSASQATFYNEFIYTQDQQDQIEDKETL